MIQTLLGGGTSFSSGGPGKGMQTKLFREVICREGWIHGVECVTAWYTKSGMLGLYGQAPHPHSKPLIDMMMYQAATIPERIDNEHLTMAKNQLLSQLILLGEARDLFLEDQGKMVLLHNQVQHAADLMKGCEKVTMSDLKRVCRSLFKHRSTYVVYGNTEGVPKPGEAFDEELRRLAGITK